LLQVVSHDGEKAFDQPARQCAVQRPRAG
jgi:hypothetical protein